MMATTPMHTRSCKVLSEETITSTEMQQKLGEFLSKKHVKEGLSRDDYSRLRGLQKSLTTEVMKLNSSY